MSLYHFKYVIVCSILVTQKRLFELDIRDLFKKHVQNYIMNSFTIITTDFDIIV